MSRSGMQFGSERSEDQASTETFAGVSLVQLASIAAARAEGFSLEEILNAEGLDVGAYRAADIEYKKRLVEPNDRERLAADYAQELARAEDRANRKISPLDEDVEAWVRFLGAYGNQAAPADWLGALGLTSPDLARLSRNWKQRMETDDDLRKKAEKSAREDKPYDASSLKVLPAKLVPSPLAKPMEKPILGDAAGSSNDEPKPVKRWMPRIDTREEPKQKPFESSLSQAPFEMPIPVAAPAALAMTSPVFSLPREEVLPFASGPVLADEPLSPEEEVAADAGPRDALSGTSLSLDIPRGPAIPFAQSKAASAIQEKPIVPEKPVFTPKLPLEHHAAMTIEIVTYPAHALAILQRYGLTPPEKVDLDQYYQRLIASDPAKYAAWHAAYGAHYATLMRAQRR